MMNKIVQINQFRPRSLGDIEATYKQFYFLLKIFMSPFELLTELLGDPSNEDIEEHYEGIPVALNKALDDIKTIQVLSAHQSDHQNYIDTFEVITEFVSQCFEMENDKRINNDKKAILRELYIEQIKVVLEEQQ